MMASPWKPYRRKGYTELRPYVPGEDLTGISVSAQDTPQAGGCAVDLPRPANMEEVP